MFYIYKITNIINNKIYIGQTNNPELRWSHHRYRAKSKDGKHINQLITRAMAKYGSNNFCFEIIATCLNKDDVDFVECQIISQYNSCDKSIGYNINLGGNSAPKNPETSQKISKALTKFYSENVHWNKGGSHSEDWRINISKSQAGIDKKNNRRFTEDIENEICKKYLDEKKSTYYIGKVYNCYRSLILDILKRHNIEKRKSNYTGHSNNCNIFTKEQEEQICDNYITGKFSRAKLAEMYNCGKTTIRDILLRNNVDLKFRKRGINNE